MFIYLTLIGASTYLLYYTISCLYTKMEENYTRLYKKIENEQLQFNKIKQRIDYEIINIYEYLDETNKNNQIIKEDINDNKENIEILKNMNISLSNLTSQQINTIYNTIYNTISEEIHKINGKIDSILIEQSLSNI